MDSSPYHLHQNSQRSLSIVTGAIEDHSSIPRSYISNRKLMSQAKQVDAQKGTPQKRATGQTHIALMTGMWILTAAFLVVNPWGKKARHSGVVGMATADPGVLPAIVAAAVLKMAVK